MKKTLNINIGNTIIHIEEDAYDTLTAYLNEVKVHFAKSADSFEIVTDIENRIAEMFAEILQNQQKQVIDIEDVSIVTKQMGSIQDFETEEGEQTDTFVPNYGQVKKLYRDTDQAVIAGVCAGLAHYLNIEDRWVRLGAILTVLLGGSGILAYIVLWVMIPKAETKSEKMTMRGEEANLRGFANSYVQPFVSKSRGFLAEAFELLGRFIQGTGGVVFKTIALFIISVGSLTLVILIIGVVALLGVWDAEVIHRFPFNIVNEDYFSFLTLGAFLTFAIPLLALVLFTIRVAFSHRPVNRTFSLVLLIFWLTGLGITVFHGAKIFSEFKESAEFAQTAEIKSFTEYTLEIDRTKFFTREDSLQFHIDSGNYRGRRILSTSHNDFDVPRNVRLRFEKSEGGNSSIGQNFRSKGLTFEDALANAQNIHYTFHQQDSVLAFKPRLDLRNKANWRDQEVEMTLKLPVGTKLKINRELSRYLSFNEYWDCDRKQNSGFTELVMTVDGLKCQHEHVQEDIDE